MRIIKLIIIINFLFCLSSCKTLREGFTNEKKNSTDEFLVEKKSPLIMPPSYNELPIPKSEIEQEEKNSDQIDIKSLIINKEPEIIKDDKKIESNSSIEESILKKINN